MLVRILGLIDLIAGATLLTLIFQIHPFLGLVLFCAGLLFLKGLFILSGDMLSLIDLIASLSLLLSLVFTLPSFLIWMCTFLLIAKGVVSFL